MNITTLPEGLNIGNTSSAQLFDYRIYDSCLKNKIKLTKNTFSFLVEGTKEVITDYTSTIIRNDAFLIIKSGNCLMTETISDKRQIYKSILLFFTDQMLFDILEKSKFHSSNKSKKSTAFLVCNYDAYIKQFVQSLETILLLEKPLQTQLLSIKFEEIITYLIQREGIDFLDTLLVNPQNSVFSQVIERNKYKKLSLQELSFLCNMSLSSFKRAFAKQYETTPIKWFQEQRLEHAAFLLSTQQKRPIEIYEEIGFESLSNFIQAFKRKYEITPKQFQSTNLNF